jgi:hypothetical protein
VPGSGHEVVPPDAVRDLAAEIVLVMNPLYVDEVRGSLETAGIAADVVAVGAEPVKPAGERIP